MWIFSSILLQIFLCFNLLNSLSLCPNNCQNHGECSVDGLCQCNRPWIGPDCSLLQCPKGRSWDGGFQGVDVAHTLVECSNRGICDRTTGLCQCNEAFTGISCNRLACSCNGHGRCISMKDYAMTKDPGIGSIFKYDRNWDSESIYGCICDDGYTGYDCSERKCPLGDDPLTPDSSVSIQVNDKQIVNCMATDGWFTLSFRGYMTKPIYANESVEGFQEKLQELPSVHELDVTYGPLSSTACSIRGNDISIEFLQDFGTLPKLIGNAEALSLSGVFSSALLKTTKVYSGTKENIPCSGRGSCDKTTGICTCYESKYRSSDGYGNLGLRGDCGHPVTTIDFCPGGINNICSGHGICTGEPTYQCLCYNGWQGGDCSEHVCLFGKAWFDLPAGDNSAHAYAECSNMGTCDRSNGQCICRPGFSGDACNRMDCPSACHGHGRCMTINELAKEYTINGDDALYTYGNVANSNMTWDYEMVQGCLCDSTWFGHDCSLRACPTGDDIITTTQADGSLQTLETQAITCTGTEGTFTLTFRKQTTDFINYNASPDELQTALEMLDTVGTINVKYSSGESFCTANGSNQVLITFLDDLGSLPSLTSSFQLITSIVIISNGTPPSVKGSKENAICSNRGVCDETSGLCKCFEGFASSDGNGKPGIRGDCGYFRPFLTSTDDMNDEL